MARNPFDVDRWHPMVSMVLFSQSKTAVKAGCIPILKALVISHEVDDIQVVDTVSSLQQAIHSQKVLGVVILDYLQERVLAILVRAIAMAIAIYTYE